MKGTLCLAAVLIVAVAGASAAAAGRIVGGESVAIEQYPSVVQVEFLSHSGVWTQSCAGTLLTSRYFLSAARCFSGLLYGPNARRIRAGATQRDQGGEVRYVSLAINHPQFDEVARDADISVVQLRTVVVWSNSIQPATIVAQGSVVPDNWPVVHVGWGALESGGAWATDLQQVNIFTINRDVCRARYSQLGSQYVVTDGMLCVGVLDVGGRDACEGDSGAPLFLGNLVVGVASWGMGCADAVRPSVTTNVAAYTDWIVSTVETT